MLLHVSTDGRHLDTKVALQLDGQMGAKAVTTDEDLFRLVAQRVGKMQVGTQSLNQWHGEGSERRKVVVDGEDGYVGRSCKVAGQRLTHEGITGGEGDSGTTVEVKDHRLLLTARLTFGRRLLLAAGQEPKGTCTMLCPACVDHRRSVVRGTALHTLTRLVCVGGLERQQAPVVRQRRWVEPDAIMTTLVLALLCHPLSRLHGQTGMGNPATRSAHVQNGQRSPQHACSFAQAVLTRWDGLELCQDHHANRIAYHQDGQCVDKRHSTVRTKERNGRTDQIDWQGDGKRSCDQDVKDELEARSGQ